MLDEANESVRKAMNDRTNPGGGCWTYSDDNWQDGAIVPLTDRGFRYGMSVFETFAIRRGRVVWAEEHMIRLRQAAEAAGFACPESLAFPSHWGLQEGMGRIYVTAGDGTFLGARDGSRIYAMAEEARFPHQEDLARGMRVGLCRAPVCGALGGWKTGNYWSHVQALVEARAQGLDENLLLNAGGGLVSAAMANVFFWREGGWQTPALETGARDGVVRAWVLRHSRVVESVFLPEDLASVRACVLTNSRFGVMPVIEIDGRLMPEPERAQELAGAYHAEIISA